MWETNKRHYFRMVHNFLDHDVLPEIETDKQIDILVESILGYWYDCGCIPEPKTLALVLNKHKLPKNG